MSRPLRIGTRGSALARWQSEHVAERLRALDPTREVELVVIHTQGDKILDVPLARIGDRGLFVKEIEEALLRGEVDLAVHSLKDMPTAQPEGLVLAAISERHDPRDSVVSRHGGGLAALPPGAVVGTSSLRRRAQLMAAYPRLEFRDVRGNVNTRLAKLDAGDYDALIMAKAGLERLGLEGRITEVLGFEICLPAVGQGALAVETREADAETRGLVERAIADPATTACTRAERALLAALEGGCQVPIAAHAVPEGDGLALSALVASLDGSVLKRCVRVGPMGDPEALGRAAAADLLAQGAAAILDDVRAAAVPPSLP